MTGSSGSFNAGDVDSETTFESFYKSFGFNEYPFAIFSAEGERRRLEELFVRPAVYSPLIDTFQARSSVVVSGERGTGKTALVYELMRSADKFALNVYIEDFSGLAIGYDSSALYSFLLDCVAGQLLECLVERPLRIWRLSKDDRLLLSYLVKFHLTQISRSRLEERIRIVQIPIQKRAGVWIYNKVRGLLNYGASVAINVTSDIIQRHFPGLPALDNTGEREYFPALRADKLDTVEAAKANFGLLTQVAQLSGRLGFTSIVFVLDKIDEEPRLENDAANIADFLKGLLTDNKLLLNGGVQFLIACWSIPLEQLKPFVRFQKLSLQRVVWSESELISVLNKRLWTFSGGKVTAVVDIIDPTAMSKFNELVLLANRNPRDLWHLMDAILKKQYELDPCSSRVSEQACVDGARKFVAEFNFYEYYPRSARARSSTMDVYAYIAHLLKLPGDRFTKNQLAEGAGTGSSTNNYVVAMENMGLIGKSDSKGDGGAVIYAVRDPKVSFARSNGIQIQRLV